MPPPPLSELFLKAGPRPRLIAPWSKNTEKTIEYLTDHYGHARERSSWGGNSRASGGLSWPLPASMVLSHVMFVAAANDHSAQINFQIGSGRVFLVADVHHVVTSRCFAYDSGLRASLFQAGPVTSASCANLGCPRSVRFQHLLPPSSWSQE